MTPTSVTTVGGVVIVTQVIPKDDSSILLQTPADPARQAPPPAVKTSPTKEESKAATFLRGEPQGLGVVQIFIGLLGVLLSLTAIFCPALIGFAPLGLAAVFVVSGSLAVASGRRTSVSLVWGSLLSNVLSILLGVAGLIYVGLLFASEPPSSLICGPRPDTSFPYNCSYKLQYLDVTVFGLLGLCLFLLVLQVCVSIGVCVFSGKVIRKLKRSAPITVLADDGRTLLSAAGSELNSEDDLHAQSP
ncbi:membrane-spanning 4-domains subfamily A member 4A [Leuresthes tenuis]|uniref:membrane-spanning 4-domains subfamily A member 4A n=1 Tax=Leuresthes tenuis TaxID=355514 RepID=UPI003B51397E